MSELETKDLIQKIGSAFDEYKKTVDEEIKQLKAKGSADTITTEKISKIDAALNDWTEAKQALDARLTAAEKAVSRPRGDDKSGEIQAKHFAEFNSQLKSINRPAVEAEAFEAYQKGFSTWLRKGDDALLSDAERKAMSVGSDPDGGYWVLPEISARIVTRLFDTSPLRQVATVETISSDALEGLRDTDEASGGWVGETDARVDSNTPQLGKWRIEANEMYSQPSATQKMLDDAAFDVEGWLAMKVSDKLSRLENTAFIIGTSAGQPKGITSYPTAATADASRGWGTMEHVPTGVTASFGTTGDPLFDLIQAFKPGYLNGASFVTRRSVVTAIRKLKGTGNDYLWQPGLQMGQPSQLLGYPILMAEDMPAIGTNSLSMMFGNFREGYTIVDRLGIRVLRDPFTNKPFVRFYTTKRTGGAVNQFEAIKALKFGTS